VNVIAEPSGTRLPSRPTADAPPVAQPESEWFAAPRHQSAHRAGAWSAVSTVATTASQFVGAIVLSRILSPEEFGTFALASALYTFPSQLIGPSLVSATVQQPELSEQQASNMFWTCLGVYSLIGLVFVATAPFVGSFYQEPVLTWIMMVYGVVLAVDGTAIQHRALLTRAMRFDVFARAALVIGPLSLLVGVMFAWVGAGPWALVAQMVVTVLLDRLVLFSAVRWRPLPFRRFADYRSLLHFSGKSALASALHLLYSQSQTIVLGRMASVADVGIYSRGQGLFLRPLLQIFNPLQAVLLPLFSARRHDSEALGVAVRKATAVLLAMIVPLTAWMIAAGPDIAETLLGPRWRVVGDTLRLFAIGATPWIWLSPLGKVNEAFGHPSRAASVRIVLLPVLILGLAWAAPKGATYAAGLYAVIEWLSVPLGFWLLTREMPLRLGYFLRPAFEFGVAMVLLACVIGLITMKLHEHHIGPIVCAGATFFAAYVIGGLMFICLPMGRLALRELLHFARSAPLAKGSL
jgi:PST family polysaccharide transporter